MAGEVALFWGPAETHHSHAGTIPIAVGAYHFPPNALHGVFTLSSVVRRHHFDRIAFLSLMV